MDEETLRKLVGDTTFELFEHELQGVCEFGGTTGTSASDSFDGMSGAELIERMQAVMAEFKQIRRGELRSWSDAIEKVGPCPRCGHKITLRREHGDALVLCSMMFSVLRHCSVGSREWNPPAAIRGIRLEPFLCKPRAPLQ